MTPNNEQLAKMLAIVGLMPVLGDFIEDCIDDKLITQGHKKAYNELLRHIRRIDENITSDMDKESIEQQIAMQRAFRQWHKQAFEQEI